MSGLAANCRKSCGCRERPLPSLALRPVSPLAAPSSMRSSPNRTARLKTLSIPRAAAVPTSCLPHHPTMGRSPSWVRLCPATLADRSLPRRPMASSCPCHRLSNSQSSLPLPSIRLAAAQQAARAAAQEKDNALSSRLFLATETGSAGSSVAPATPARQHSPHPSCPAAATGRLSAPSVSLGQPPQKSCRLGVSSRPP